MAARKTKPSSLSGGLQKESVSKALQIGTSGASSLSNNQKKFNNLIARIDLLRCSITEESERIERVLNEWTKKIVPLRLAQYEARLFILQQISNAAKTMKFGKRQKGIIANYLISSIYDLFENYNIEPTQEAIDLFNEWSDLTFEEAQETEQEQMKDVFSSMFNSAFGVDLDREDFDLSPDELREKLKEKIGDQFDYEGDSASRQKQTQRKKSKKELEQEAQEKAAEELKTKNLRSIYIALAKVLHPDISSDTDNIAEREELMKLVTKAYEEKDLSTLLRLELEWVHRQSDHLDALSDDKLLIYIKVLEEQCKDLITEKYSLFHHPRCTPIQRFLLVKDVTAKKYLKMDVNTLENNILYLKQTSRQIETMSKTELFRFIQDNFDTNHDDDDFDFMNFLQSMR